MEGTNQPHDDLVGRLIADKVADILGVPRGVPREDFEDKTKEWQYK